MADDAKTAIAVASLKRTLSSCGPAAIAAVDAPECARAIEAYVQAVHSLEVAMRGFDGTDASARAVERSAATYRIELRVVSERVGRIALAALAGGSRH